MELKFSSIPSLKSQSIVLIVPYGIEMKSQDSSSGDTSSFNRTLWNWNMVEISNCPYVFHVLIVPYGIEIQGTDEDERRDGSF